MDVLEAWRISMSEITLEFKNLTKEYGEKKALLDFTTTLKPGIYGLLGPNGAGKSTLMNLLTDNIKRTSGEILYNGEEILKLSSRFREKIGYMPQQQGMYDNFSGERFLYYVAGLKGVKRRAAREQIDKYLNMVGLTKDKGRKLGGYSGGMRQRLMFVAAMLGEPEILILDEPTAGLDPEERIKIRNYVSELSGERIVILATHVVSDIECIASEILLLKKGKLICKDTPASLVHSVSDKIYVKYCDHAELKELMKQYPRGNISQGEDGIRFRIVKDECPDGFEAESQMPNLEDVYLYWF